MSAAMKRFRLVGLVLVGVLVASVTPPAGVSGAQPPADLEGVAPADELDPSVAEADLSDEELAALEAEQGGDLPPDDRVAVDGDGDVFAPVVADDGPVVTEAGPDRSELDRPGLEPVTADVAVTGTRDAVEDASLPVRLEPTAPLESAGTVRVQVLDEGLASQVSSLDAAVAVDLVDAEGARVGAGAELAVEFDLADVVVPVAASGWERLRLVWWSDCYERSGVVDCSGRRVLDTTVDRDARVLSAVVDPDAEAAAAADAVTGLVDDGVAPLEADAEVRIDTLIERRDDLLAAEGERYDGPETSVFAEPVATHAEAEPTEAPTAEPAGEPAGAPLDAPGEDGTAEEAVAGPAQPAGVGPGAGGFAMLSVTTGSSGASGDFAATPWPTLSEFQTGLFTGAAESFYRIEVPAPEAGPAPEIGLSYSSAAIDGLNTSTNTQVGPVGVGWSLSVGSIVEHMRPCEFGGDAAGEVCIAKTTPAQDRHFSISLNGKSSRLIPTGTSSGGATLYRLQDDPMWRVQLFTGGSNKDSADEYWVVTDRDGTQYRFGHNSASADYRPVYYPTGGGWTAFPQTCSATASRLCNEVYQWNLDRVTDTDDNRIVYRWAQELNYYNGRQSAAWVRSYVRASRPLTIEYTLGNGESNGNARVKFNWDTRCNKTDTTFTCAEANFFDTPNDLWCHHSHNNCNHLGDQTATFWSQLRLGSIQTQIWQSGTNEPAVSWHTVATHDLISGFPVPPTDSHGDESERKLFLYRIVQRPGDNYEHWGFSYLWPADADASPGLNVGDPAADWGVSAMAKPFNNTNKTAQHLRFDDVYIGATTTAPPTRVFARVSSGDGAVLQLRRNSPTGTVLGEFTVPDTNGPANWVTVDAPVANLGTSDVVDLYLTTKSHGSANTRLAWIVLRPGAYGQLDGLPSTNFNPPNSDPTFLKNRLNHPDGVSPMYMPRITSIRNSTGGRVIFTYGQSRACQTNTTYDYTDHDRDCFPGYDAFTGSGGWVAWNKWKVVSERRFDDFDGNPSTDDSANDDLILNYSYAPPAWALDDDPLQGCLEKSWNSFRGHSRVTVTEVGPFSTTLGRTEHRFFRGMHQDPDGCGGATKNVTLSLHDAATTYPAPDNSAITDWFQFRGRTLETRVLPPTGSIEQFRTVTRPRRVSTAGSGLDGAWSITTQRNWDWRRNGPTYLETRERFEYDNWDNPTGHVMIGDPTTSADDRHDFRSFYNNTSGTNWIIGAPKQSQRRTGDTVGAGTIETWQRWLYDGNGYGTAPTVGNVTEARTYTGTGGAHLATVMTYDNRGRVATTTSPEGGVTTNTYDATHGTLTEIDRPLELDDEYFPDNMARVYRHQAPNSANTYAAFDDYGRVINVWAPTEATGYPTGTATQKHTYYDGSFPLRTRTRQLISGTSYAQSWAYYDGSGRTIQTDTATPDPAYGRIIDFTMFNAQGQPARTSAPPWVGYGTPGSSLLTPYWPNMVDYDETTYDAYRRPTQTRRMFFSTELWKTTVNYTGRTVASYDANDHRVDRITDAHGNLVSVVEYNDVNGSNYTPYATTTYDYDAADRLEEVTDHAGNDTVIGYDLVGRKRSLTDPSTGAWTYAYDGDSNLTRQSHNASGRHLTMTYDAAGRPLATHNGTTTAAPLLRSMSYWTTGTGTGQVEEARAYDGAGTHTSTWSHTYDTAGRLNSRELEIHTGPGAGTYGLDFTHTPANQLASVSYPTNLTGGTGDTFTYTYDPTTGLLDSGASTNGGAARLIDRQYDAIARPKLNLYGAQYSSTTVQAQIGWGYDIYTERLQKITARRGSSSWDDLVDTQYFYDDNGNITRTLDWRNPWIWGGQNQCFTYDDQNRLVDAWTHMAPSTCANTTASDTDGTYTVNAGTTYDRNYLYDQIGNLDRRTETWGGTSTWQYHYGAGNAGPHAVTSIDITGVGAGTHTFAYDNAGNMTTRDIAGQPTQTLSYDTFNQLTALTASGVTTNYLYDAFGTRIREFDPTGHTVFIDKWAEHNGSHHTQHFYIDNTRFAYRYNNSLTYLFTDHLDSVIASNFTYFNNVKFRRYLPFGDIRGNPTDVPTPYGYTSQRRDDTDLMYYQSRYYDPLTGRFAQPDTIVPSAASPQTLNRYSYVINNPLKYNDPTGHNPCLSSTNIADCTQEDADRLESTTGSRPPAPPPIPSPGAPPPDPTRPPSQGGSSWASDFLGSLFSWKNLNPMNWRPGCSSTLLGYGSGGCQDGIDGVRALASGDPAAWGSVAQGAVLARLAFPAKRIASSGVGTRAPQVLQVGDVKLPAVPNGAVGTLTESGRGLQYPIRSGTPELDSRVTHIRIMDPLTTGKYHYPDGYATYMNRSGQTVNPLTGDTISNSHPFAHIPLK